MEPWHAEERRQKPPKVLPPFFENLSRITTLSNITGEYSPNSSVLPLSRITTLSNSPYSSVEMRRVLPLSRITTLSNDGPAIVYYRKVLPLSRITTLSNNDFLWFEREYVLPLSRITTLSNIWDICRRITAVLPLSRITTLSNLKLHFHAAVLCKCIRLHQAAQFLTVYHYSKIWHKSLSIMKRSSAFIVSWQGPSRRTKLRFSSLAFS